MWTRKELKQRAKDALARNYWKIVLVVLLSIMIYGSISSSASTGSSQSSVVITRNADAQVEYADGVEPITEIVPQTGEGIVNGVMETLADSMQEMSDVQIIVYGVTIAVVILLVVLAVWAVVYACIALLENPFSVGVCRFMVKSVEDKAEVKEVAYGFDHSYKNIVKTMFQMDLRVFGWACLFIIPGIYKKYQYRMVPYILAKQPDMPYKEALRLSSDMMHGEKWRAFILDLSFIPWHLLGIITCGVVELFYVGPYKYLTQAALYCRLSERQADDGI
ncbi:MAG: DUF975 family protein [Lachnospiraceae bacterium]|nr:DUF975 family protein [Lachnospiraceae bacterium]